MMAQTMIEKMARAIAREDRIHHLDDVPRGRSEDEFVEQEWMNYLDHASAVMEAMRDPTPAMIEAARAKNEPWDPAEEEVHWRAMIDAALAEG